MVRIINSIHTDFKSEFPDVIEPGIYSLEHLALNEELLNLDNYEVEVDCFNENIVTCLAFSYDAAYEIFMDEIKKYMENNYNLNGSKIYISGMTDVWGHNELRRVVSTATLMDGKRVTEEFIVHRNKAIQK